MCLVRCLSLIRGLTPSHHAAAAIDACLYLAESLLLLDIDHSAPQKFKGLMFALLLLFLEIPRRNNTLAGPFDRRSDKVGGFFFIHRDDLKRMSHLWLSYTEDVRADPEVSRAGEQ